MNKLLYNRVSQDKAKELMKTFDDYVILDVRTKEEYTNGHIKGAINFPNEDIFDEEIPGVDFETPLFIYCRSGRKSLNASAKLGLIGYTNIYEFGGINTWEDEIEK